MFLQIIIFLASCIILSWMSSSLIKTLTDIAKFLKWREFIIAFFVMAFAASLPNLFVDLNAALRGVPEIAFGDIVGGNLVDLTLVMALAVFFSPKKGISTDSKMAQSSALFTFFFAILPIFLILDGNLERKDGAILLLAFLIYTFWLFSNKDRYKKIYRQKEAKFGGFLLFLKNIVKIIILLALLLAASFGVVESAKFFSNSLGISLSLVGVLIVGLGNCFPETYFSIVSARRGEGWMILGDLMGCIIVCTTMVLGIIAFVAPFEINNLEPFFIARIFTILAALFFLFVVKTDNKITKKEGVLLLAVYIAFLITEIFWKS
jgi:cation:H+ antiporter